VIGSALGGLVASVWGVTAPFWFAFAGSALILALIWRSLLQIGHADEQTRADAPPKGTDDGSTETGHCADAER
jgi:predicted MFS family arabinose efflux permease